MIAILLATYNSEQFLREQLDSIFDQTYNDWCIYVHDDGSTDSTMLIINDYAKRYPGKICFSKTQTKGLRAFRSFLQLVDDVDSDYYMFCDHDDVWLPQKVEVSIQTLLEEEAKVTPQTPLLVHTDMYNVDVNINVISHSFWQTARLLPQYSKFEELVACNNVNGCAAMFNKAARIELLQNKEYGLMHDALLAQSVAASGGIIIPIYQPLVLYRQHGNNVIGAAVVGKKYFYHKILELPKTVKREIGLWKRTKNIKEYSIFAFMYYKLKITILRII